MILMLTIATLRVMMIVTLSDDADDLVETAIAFHDDESDIDENDDAVDEDSDDEPFVIDNNIKDDGLKDSLCLELKCSKRRATT